MQIKRDGIEAAVAWVALSGWLLCLNPAHTPLYLLVIPFVLLYLALYKSWLLLGRIWWRLTGSGGYQDRLVRQLGKLVSLFACLLTVLSSLGQLIARDVVTLFLLFVVGYFYIVRSRKRGSDGQK